MLSCVLMWTLRPISRQKAMQAMSEAMTASTPASFARRSSERICARSPWYRVMFRVR